MSSFKPAHEIVRIQPKVAVVVVSNSRFRMYLERGCVEDESGNLARDLLRKHNMVVLNVVYIPNNEDSVRGIVKSLVEHFGVNVIVMIGGTGPSPRDKTVDAVRSIADKELPGFGELFRRLSEEELGPHIILTRASAFTYRNSVIFCLPGSPSAVKLAIEKIIVPVLEHVLSEINR